MIDLANRFGVVLSLRQAVVRQAGLALLVPCCWLASGSAAQPADFWVAHPPGISQEPSSQDRSGAITANLLKIAQSITVKVLAGDSSGSGTIVQRQGDQYFVITNAHVKTPAIGRSLRIQTMDGRIYPAHVLPRPTTRPTDLALLGFSSSHSYPVARLATESKNSEGLAVYAAGYPFGTGGATGPGLVVLSGRIGLVPQRSLVGGHQIGYTNMVEKGMSGGPLLLADGRVIAINAMHAYPIWGNPYVYDDGTVANPEQRRQMRRLSWGIPSRRIAAYLSSMPNRPYSSQHGQPLAAQSDQQWDAKLEESLGQPPEKFLNQPSGQSFFTH